MKHWGQGSENNVQVKYMEWKKEEKKKKDMLLVFSS